MKDATSARAEVPPCQVLIVTGHGLPGRLEPALAAGVRGFVLKAVSAQRLAGSPDRASTVHAGNACADPGLAADAISVRAALQRLGFSYGRRSRPTGRPVAEIAERAAPALVTVRDRRSSAVPKPGAGNRRAAVRLTHDRGWV
ncbi:hypothetical protein ACWDZ8_01655 [Streptomyces sp. NPDC003233]